MHRHRSTLEYLQARLARSMARSMHRGPETSASGCYWPHWRGPAGPLGGPEPISAPRLQRRPPPMRPVITAGSAFYVAQVVLEYVDKLADGVSTPHQPGLSYSPSRSVCLLVCRAATLE